jgi:hypothetical protein
VRRYSVFRNAISESFSSEDNLSPNGCPLTARLLPV